MNIVSKECKSFIAMVLCLSLSGCASQNESIEDAYAVYKKAYEETVNAESIISSNEMKMELDVEQNVGKLLLETNSTVEMMNRSNNPTVKFSSSEAMTGFMEENMDMVGYYVDGVFYLDYDGYKVKDTSLSMEDVQNLSSIQEVFEEASIIDINGYSKEDLTTIEVELNEDSALSYLEGIIGELLDVSSVNKISGKRSIKIKDNYLIEDATNIQFEFVSSGVNGKGSLSNVNEYSSINSAVVSFDVDFAEYMNVDEYEYVEDETLKETALETLRARLVEWLGYQEDKGSYSLIFNDSESYFWNFDNHLFTYVNGVDKHVYDWKNDIGIHDKCQYYFSDGKETGACEVMDIDNIKSAKDNFEIEISMCGLKVDDILEEE